jgi:NDP-sugar pyrophosphorylase family protein
MAGGEGRRLGELTALTPKPMLPVDGRPMLQHIVEQLRDQGVRHLYISVRHLSEMVSDYFGDGRWLGVDIEYVVEDSPLDTAGALGLLPELDRPLLVMNADILTTLPVAAMVRQHVTSGAGVTIGCSQQRIPIPYGVVECTGAEVTDLHEKPDVVFDVVAGVYVVAPEVVAAVPAGVALPMPGLVEQVMATGLVGHFALPGPWLDIGSPDTYARAAEVAAKVGIRPVLEVAL